MSETVALQDVADDGCRQFGDRRPFSIFMYANIFKEASGIDTLWNQKGEINIWWSRQKIHLRFQILTCKSDEWS